MPKTKKNKKEDYLCLSAILRARETRMLSAEKAERMANAPSYSDAAKVMVDCGYPDMSSMTAKQVEDTLSLCRSQLFEEMEKQAPSKACVDAFRVKYDYHNVKVLIKAEAMGQNPASMMSSCGRIAPEVLASRYTEEKYSDLPAILGEAAKEAKSLLARTQDPQAMDFLLDKAYFKEMEALAEDAGSPFLRDYTAAIVDGTNRSSMLRCLKMNKDRAFAEEVIADGGKISREAVLKTETAEDVAALYKDVNCSTADIAASAKYVSYGDEILVSFIAQKELEMTAARMVLTGKLAGIKSEVLVERLREIYA